jgi:N6-L-threonylcarbamoyladenine synthase
MKNLKVLGIESSCDDTAVAIIDSDLNILSNIVISQNQEHSLYNGVVPEIAARSHLHNLELATNKAFFESELTINDIDVIAATSGPGLIGGVIVGSMFAKSMASALNKPFIAVNHLEGHALTVRLTDNLDYPYLLLLISGGHCQYVAVKGLGKYHIIGQTLDDAVGEAFDKVGKMLGQEFPGGPKIEKLAEFGDPDRFYFPRPIIDQKNCNMSFSGLKTAVMLKIKELGRLSRQDISDVAASFQKSVTEIIEKKTGIAISMYEGIISAESIAGTYNNLVAAGGVAANSSIRKSLLEIADKSGYNFVAPPIKLCTDNAAMIAFAGLERFKAGIINDVSFKPKARWGLEDL